MKEKNKKDIYINEVIRITYKCNWSCKFCNVLKTNNFGGNDINHQEIIYKILSLARRYNKKERKSLILSFSGGEPTLCYKLIDYIKLAKIIGVGCVQIQTNGIILFKNREFVNELIKVGLDEIFLAQHSSNDCVNKELGSFFDKKSFVKWIQFIIENNIHKKIKISLNIVITKINIYSLVEHINSLVQIGFLDILELEKYKKIISFGFCQPNGYAEINKELVLLKFDNQEKRELEKLIEVCRKNNIFPDFHFTAPPICIFNYPEYNLEYARLKNLNNDIYEGIENKENIETYKILWKEKEKFEECEGCFYNKYCLGFYKNCISFIGKDSIRKKIKEFILLNKN